MKVLTKAEIQKIFKSSEVIIEIENGFKLFSEGKTVSPPAFVFDLPDDNGEICIKTAIIEGAKTYSIKQVSIFKSNNKIGIPTLKGTINVYSNQTGELVMVLNEDGWLTNKRTACAGAIANKYFKLKGASMLGIIGAGEQAKSQISMILDMDQKYKKVVVWNRTAEAANKLVQQFEREYKSVEFRVMNKVEDIVNNADTIVTTTSAKEPIIFTEMINKPITIIGVGSDMPDKCEIDPLVFVKADKVFVDSIEGNKKVGCVSRAINTKKFSVEDISSEIGNVISGKFEGRKSEDEIIIVKLVGLGAQDSAVGEYFYNATNPI